MKLIIGISGASGAIYADQLLTFLRENTKHQVFIVASRNGRRIFGEELKKDLKVYDYPIISNDDFDAPFLSGSTLFDKMVITPCSMGTVGRIAHGVSNEVLTRTADVFLKEKRPLILVPRETPFSLIHIENLRLLALAGATIIPAIPSYYSHPQSIEALAATVTSRVLDHMGVENDLMRRWNV